MISYTSIVDGLSTWNRSKTKKTVSKDDYEIFCKEYVFDSLKGIKFGEAFCKRFDIHDSMLSMFSNELARFHIEKLGYIK